MKRNGKPVAATTVSERASTFDLRGMFWWIDRWRRSSAYMQLSLEAQAAYRNLLDESWLRGGSIPNDADILARACGDPRRWQRVKRDVLAHFRVVNGYLVNDTLLEVRGQSARRADKQRAYRQRRAQERTAHTIKKGA